VATAEERAAYYAKKHADNAKSGGGGDFAKLTYFKFKEGVNRIRIIPPFGDRMEFHSEAEQSWRVGPSYRGPITRADQYGQPDLVADEINRLKNLGDPASLARADQMRAKKNLFCFILDRDNLEVGVQGCSLNWTVFREVTALFADSEYGDVTNPDTGVDIKVTYTPGKKVGDKWVAKPAYGVVPSRNSTPLDFPEAIEECLFKKYRIEEPTEADFTAAVIAGVEQQFQDARKAERDAKKAADNPEGLPVDLEDLPHPEQEDAPTPAPTPGATDAAIQAELEAIAAKKAAPPPPPAKKAPISTTPAELLTDDYWIVLNGATVGATGKEVQSLVNDGQSMISCRPQAGEDWATPAALGFHAQPAQVGSELTEALK